MSHQSIALIEYVTGEESYTLVAVGDFLAEPLTIAAEQGLFEVDGVLARSSFFRPLGGAVATISFAVERPHAEYLTAMRAFLDPDITAGASMLAGTGSLRITVDGEETEYPDAVLVSPVPTLSSEFDVIVAIAYQFVAAAVPVEP